MRRRHLAWRTVSLVLGGAALLAQPLPAADLAIRMQQVVSRFVVQTGQSVLGIGSWISGRSFNPATSDFNMRLVITQRGPELQHLQQWRQAKARLVQLIEQEFGTEAPSILRRANLYAPNQLMTGIENAADAVERFQQLNTVPRLSHETRVIPGETPVSLMEGLYGEGARVNLQSYERAAGRVFYYNNGRCVTGLSELVHLGEETGTYTAAGTANTAGQWAEHCLAEIKAGRGDKVAKYLERLERDLFKCRSMSQLPADPALREEIWRMRTALRENPARLFDYSERIARVVARGQTEAAILRSYANAGTLRRAYLRVMLDGVAAQNAVGTQMDRIRQFASGWADLKSAFDALTFVLGTRATAQALGRGDALESLSTSASYLKWIAAFGPLVLTEITTEVLREAERSGYAMAAGSQGSWNLMSGIYTAWGRAGVDPDPRRTLTLADLVARFQYESNLREFVRAQAIRASTRDLGSATAAADKGVAQSIFDQCWPAIRDAWRWERDTLASEYLTLAEPIAMTPLLIHYKPAKVEVGVQVAFEASSAEGKLGERLARMREIMRILYGPGSGVASNFYWNPYGEGTAEADWRRTMSFAEPGTHPVTVRLEVAPFTSHTEAEKRLLERREVSALVAVEVTGVKQPPPAGGGIDVSDEVREVLRDAADFASAPGLNPQPYEITLTLGAHIHVQAAGMLPSPLSHLQTKGPPWQASYSLLVGVPVRLSVNYSAKIEPERLTLTADDSLGRNYCNVTYKQPQIDLIVETSNVASNAWSEKRVAGGSYTIEFVPKYGDSIAIRASTRVDGVEVYTGSWYTQPETRGAGFERSSFATVSLACDRTGPDFWPKK